MSHVSPKKTGVREKTVYQLQLRCKQTYLICWVDRKVKVGDIVKLKGDDRKWTVLQTWGSIGLHELNTDWKVGGLDSPRT